MSVQTEPVPPSPEHTPPLREDDGTGNGGKYFNHAWTRWFVSIREKVNVLNDSLVNLGDVTGSGILVKNGAAWLTRTLQAGFGISITNPDGIVGDPTITHSDTSSVPDVSIDNVNGVVLQDVTFTFDQAGHVLTTTFGSVDLDTRYLQDAPSDGTSYGRNNGAWVPVGGGGTGTVTSVGLATPTGYIVTGSPVTSVGTLTISYDAGFQGYTTAEANKLATLVTATITDGDTTHAPSGDAVFDAMALKQDSDKSTSGQYVPTVTPVTNVTLANGLTCNWTRVDSAFVLSGSVEVTPTASGSVAVVRLNLPLATTFGTDSDVCGGPAACKASGVAVYESGYIFAVPSSSLLNLLFLPSTTNTYKIRFSIVVPIM